LLSLPFIAPQVEDQQDWEVHYGHAADMIIQTPVEHVLKLSSAAS